MKKQIVLLGSLFLGVVHLCGMEKCPAPMDEEFVTIVTSDDKKFELPIKLAQKSETISSMMTYQLDEPIVLGLVSSQLFQVIKDVLESSEPQRILKKLSLSQLVEFIQGVNFLVVSDLIDVSIKELAERDVSQDDVNMFFEQLDFELIKRLWSVHPARDWVLKKWNESAKEIQGKGFVFSPDGRYLVAEDGGVIKIWDVNNNFEQVDSNLRHEHIQRIAFSSDGRYLVSKGGEIIKIWDVNNDFVQVGDDLQHRNVSDVTFSPDRSYLVSRSFHKGTIKLWDVNNNFEQVDVDLRHKNNVLSVTFSADGRYLVSTGIGVIKIWDVNNDFVQVGDDLQHRNVSDVTFSAGGRYLVSKGIGVIKIWDVNNDFVQVGDDLQHRNVSGVTFSADGKYLASEGGKVIKIWDVNNDFVQVGDDLRYRGIFGPVFSPDGRYLVAKGRGIIKIWNVNNDFAQVGADLRHENVSGVTFSADGRYLFSRGGEVIKIWNVDNNFAQVDGDLWHEGALDVIFSPDRSYLVSSSSCKGTIKIWDVNNSFEQVGGDLQHKDVLFSIFSQNGSYLVSLSISTDVEISSIIKIWDVNNNFAQVGDDLRQSGFIESIVFIPDGRYLVLKGGEVIKIWDLNILQQIVYPSESEIHLFLLSYAIQPREFGVFTQKPVLPFQLQQKFVHLSPEMKQFLKILAPQFKDEFEAAEKSFGID